MSAAALVAGVDEAGRGPLAGPVVAAAVILAPRMRLPGVRDSKELSAEERDALAPHIRAHAVAWGIGLADVEEIDALNILGATLLAMRRALLALAVRPVAVQVDGNRCPSLDGLGCPLRGEAIVRGDSSVLAISAASILAKTFRDSRMHALHEVYPQYGFRSHVGYGTPQHLEALATFGPCPLHRRTFAPVESAAEAVRRGEKLAVVNRRLIRADSLPGAA